MHGLRNPKSPLILVKCYHLGIWLPSVFFPSGFHTKTFYPFLFSPLLAICCAHHIIAIKESKSMSGNTVSFGTKKKTKSGAININVSLNNFMVDF